MLASIVLIVSVIVLLLIFTVLAISGYQYRKGLIRDIELYVVRRKNITMIDLITAINVGKWHTTPEWKGIASLNELSVIDLEQVLERYGSVSR